VLIDDAISGDRNVFKTAAEEILKYKDLKIEIQRMWDVKTKAIPLITGANRAMCQYQLENTGTRNQGTTYNNHIGHCTHTWESTNLKVHKIKNGN
jgi:hypothetical protein